MYESPNIEVVGSFTELTEKKHKGIHIYKGGTTGDVLVFSGESSSISGGYVIGIS